MSKSATLPGVPADRIIEPEGCQLNASFSSSPFVIIGAGPVGVRALRLFRKARPTDPVVIFGDEPYEPYDRVQLSGVLAGQHSTGDILLAGDGLLDCAATQFVPSKVVSIDREKRYVKDQSGRLQYFSKLLIATGSHPHVPAIVGIDQSGVFTFRNMKDAEKLAARRVLSKHTVVLGAGLLGVEAACAMRRHNTCVTLVDHNPHPLFRQLDPESSGMVSHELTQRQVEQRFGDSVRMILGTGKAEGVVLNSGEHLDCDTFVLATGIRPNKQIAVDAKLAYGRGITVDDHMQTSDPNIYAVGECCEFEQQVYGLVAPGFDQAAIAVEHILGATEACYTKPQLATSLKVAGLSVFSLGDPEPLWVSNTHIHRAQGSYRRVSFHRGRIVSVNAVGDWPELPRLRDQAKKSGWVSPIGRARFLFTGNFYGAAQSANVLSWPDSATVCNCNAVSCGQIREAAADGAVTVAALGQVTRAGTSCGSCRPLVAAMLGAESPSEPVKGSAGLRGVSITALLVSCVALIWALDYPTTVQLEWRWDELWRSNDLKKTSGFTILGLSVASLLFSLRKRIKAFTLWDFAWWRIAHAALTLGALGAVAVHTGFRLGANLNFYLMITFLGLALAGALLGASVAFEHRMQPAQAQRLRSIGVWGHVLLAWPLPALLGLHVWKTFYF
ncbi:MAG: FAD-dependent oxidoreductase [Halioglobus sp.]